MPVAEFIGGVVDGQTLAVEDKPVILIIHPDSSSFRFVPQMTRSQYFFEDISAPIRLKTDRYQQNRWMEPDGSISVVYVYEGTDG